MGERVNREFDDLVLPHLDDAYTLACYLLRDEHDAQDVVQDSVLRALRYFGSFRDGDARSWLLSIVRRQCYSWLKGSGVERRSVPLSADASGAAVDPHGTDERAIRSSERERLSAALGTLPAELREVIVLRELSGLSYREISDVIGIPMGTVMSRLARARERLGFALGAGTREAS